MVCTIILIKQTFMVINQIFHSLHVFFSNKIFVLILKSRHRNELDNLLVLSEKDDGRNVTNNDIKLQNKIWKFN